MIIRSMSRKKPSFGELIRYMNKNADPHFNVLQHLPSNEPSEIQLRFENNYRLLKRKGQCLNALFHEVISLKRYSGVALHCYIRALYEIIPRYLSLRGSDLLAFGSLHIHKHHVHVHLMLSTNSIGSPTRHRLTPFDYAILQKKIEAFVLTQYPELKQEPILNKEWKKSSPIVQYEQSFDNPLDFI